MIFSKRNFLLGLLLGGMTFFSFLQLGKAQPLTFHVPQVVNGSGFKTLITITNLSASSSASFSIQVTLDAGGPAAILSVPGQSGGQSSADLSIQPGGQITLSTVGGNPLVVGWAVITSNSSVGVSAVFLFSDGAGNVISAAGVLPQSSQTAVTLVGLINSKAKTGVAILNAGLGTPAVVTLKLLNNAGVQVSTTKTLTIAPQRKIAQFFNEGELFTDITDFEGTVAISSDIPIQVMSLRIDFPSGAISTLPSLPGRAGVPAQHADATFSWIDATPAGGGSRVSFAGDVVTGDVNNVVISLNIPFSVVFYGTTYGSLIFDHISIAEDGWMSFLAAQPSTPHPLPSASSPPALIAALFADLHFNVNNTSVGVFSRTLGSQPTRQFVLEWKDVSFVNASLGTTTFEIVLFEGTSDIKLQILNPGSNVPALIAAGLSIGIQDDTRTLAVPVNLSTNPPAANKVYTFLYNGGTSYALIQN